MRKIVLAVGCMCLLTAPAWAGGGFSLFGTYGQVNDSVSSGGFGGRVSFGGQRLVVDLTATWFPASNGAIVKNGCATEFQERYHLRDHVLPARGA